MLVDLAYSRSRYFGLADEAIGVRIFRLFSFVLHLNFEVANLRKSLRIRESEETSECHGVVYKPGA